MFKVAHTLGKLMWSIHIVGSDCYQRQLEAAPICADHHLCCRLASRVWVCRGQYACLAQICGANWYVAVHLVRRYMYEPIDAMLSRSFEQDMCAVYVRVREFIRIAEAEVDMRLRGEMEDSIDIVLPQHTLYVCRQCDVPVFECEVRSVIENSCVVERGAVVQLVEGDHIVVWVCEDQMAYEPASSAPVSDWMYSKWMSRDTQLATLMVPYMKPAPPVIKTFCASRSGSNLVLPVSNGACFQSSCLT
jgi:hypothetical protein